MMIGTQIAASNGFGGLDKDASYYFLKSDAVHSKVWLVRFILKPRARPNSILIGIPRSEFEGGLDANELTVIKEQQTLPPWLGNMSEEKIWKADQVRLGRELTLQGRAEKRLEHIEPLLAREAEILSAENPTLEINRCARAIGKNETRLRTWFLSYLLFGRNVFALCPDYLGKIGHWDRTSPERACGPKYGRRSKKRGTASGYRVDKRMKEKIVNSYVRRRDLGKPLLRIYSTAMGADFGCKVLTDEKGRKCFYHPDSQPFPSYGQYRYHVVEYFTPEEVRRALYGDDRVRNRSSASAGRFSSAVANLMERVESDGYYTSDYPSSPVGGEILPPLCVVRTIDVGSSYSVGIGFSLTKERSDAYRMAQFCAAISKVEFARLFGIRLNPGEWESIGLSPFWVCDRGPGSKADLREQCGDLVPIRELPPSHSGRSKATVETANPRSVTIEGKPTYVKSDLNPVQMAVREIYRLIERNHSCDVSHKLTPEMIDAETMPTPAGIWAYLEKKGRTDALAISFQDAVRRFLTEVHFTVESDGVYLHGQRFDSSELRATGVIDRVARGQRLEWRGYVLDLCVRYAWIEIDGRIIEVAAVLSIRDDESQLSVTIQELEQRAARKAILEAEFREHQQAVRSEIEERFEESTGMAWDAGSRKTGRPKTGCRKSKAAQAAFMKVASPANAK
ncbi:hypothetical protein SAMN05444172_8381 [Burkholderia sp. GAS332]|nr:hypothetical protein SAMN05444172_8381 [Burkholderia sp. GAS332]